MKHRFHVCSLSFEARYKLSTWKLVSRMCLFSVAHWISAAHACRHLFCWSRRKPNWVLVCPYFYRVFLCAVLTDHNSWAFRRDHCLVWPGSYCFSHNLVNFWNFSTSSSPEPIRRLYSILGLTVLPGQCISFQVSAFEAGHCSEQIQVWFCSFFKTCPTYINNSEKHTLFQ